VIEKQTPSAFTPTFGLFGQSSSHLWADAKVVLLGAIGLARQSEKWSAILHALRSLWGGRDGRKSISNMACGGAVQKRRKSANFSSPGPC